MKKHILLGTALASLFALGACDYNEDNFPGFDEKETITDVSTDTLSPRIPRGRLILRH